MIVIRDADDVQQQFVCELRALEEIRQRRNQFITESSAEFADVADDPEVGQLLDEARNARPDLTYGPFSATDT